MSLSDSKLEVDRGGTDTAVADSAAYGSICGWLTQPKASKGVRLADDSGGWALRPYTELAADAHGIAARLVDEGVAPGDGVCIVLPTDFPCIAAMFAVWSSGASVTLVPPPVFGGGDEYEEHLSAILTRAAPRLVVTTTGLGALVARGMRSAEMPGSPVTIDEADTSLPSADMSARLPERPAIAATDIAMVQFTSGSSGTPKGVRISWRNLAANTKYIIESVAWQPEDTTVSWLPLYHDMGLVGGLLATVANQGDLYLMRPDQFVRDPLRWVSTMAISQHSVTPSFGLGYAARRIENADVAGLDLSGFRSIIVGAEPIDTDHVRAFTSMLAGTGYDPTSIRPAYGLAESTLMATVSPSGSAPVAVQIDSTALRFGDRVPIRAETEYRGQELDGGGWIVGLGGSTEASTVRIVDSDGNVVPDGVLGEVAVSGESVAEGYHDDGESSVDAGGTRFIGGELFSGDAGFVHAGILYVLGRMGSSIKVRGKSVFMEDVDARVAHETGLPKHKFAAVAMSESGAAQGIVLFVEHTPGQWIDDARRVLRADLGAAHKLTVVTGDRGLVRRTSSGKPRRRLMWELFRNSELGVATTVHDAATPIAPPAERTFDERRPSTALLTDTEIGVLLDRALDAVDVGDDSTILLEGSIAEGFGNEGSDIDFLAVSPGDDDTPEMPTVLFIGGRRVEVRTRSEAQVRAQLEYARSALFTEHVDDAGLLELNQDLLNRCQRFSRAAVVRSGTVDVDRLREVLPDSELGQVLARWWFARAQQSLRQAVAMSALDARVEALDWARDGLLQSIKGWASGRGETYLETKWIGPQLERIGDDDVTDSYFTLTRSLLRGDADLASALEFAEKMGASVPEDHSMVVLSRVRQVTSWPIDGRIHVVRGDSDVFVLSDRAARAWRSVVFGRSVRDITARWSEPLRAEVAEFVRLGLVGLRWGRGPALRPAVAMVKPHRPYTCLPSGVVPVLGLGGATRVDGAVATLVPMPARRFTECASGLVWSNVIVENAREDLVGALGQKQGRVADVAADRMLKGAVRLLLSVLGASPLPPDVAPVATLERLIPAEAPRRDELLVELRKAQLVTFAGPDRSVAETGLAVLDTFVESVRAMAKLQFPASFDSQAQWRRTLEITYDWLRLAAYLDAELPIDEVQDLLSSGGAQPHQRDHDTRGKKSS